MPLEPTGIVITGYYTCNGSPRGCERERFGGCRWCDEVSANDGITRDLANSLLTLLAVVHAELADDTDIAWKLLAIQRRLIEARRLEVSL